jgi:hypothetical protein
VNKHDESVAIAEHPAVAGTVTGTLVGFHHSGEPLIRVPGQHPACGVRARTCVSLRQSDIGRTVVLAYNAPSQELPIVLGLVMSPQERSAEVEIDSKTIVLAGHETIVLRCGDASITLNRDGKVVIRGKHIVTHASGVNRIRGGSVQLN